MAVTGLKGSETMVGGLEPVLHVVGDSGARPSPVRKSGAIWCKCLLLAALALPASLVFLTTAKALLLHGDSTYPESAVVYNALQAVRTGHLYRPLAQPPSTPAPYGPLFYGLLAAIGWAGNLSLDGLRIAGRIVSLTCFLACTALAFKWTRRTGTTLFAAICACAFVLAETTVAPWNASVRPDFLAVMMTLAGIYYVTYAKNERKGTFVAALLFGGAILAKQSFIAAPLAAVASMLLQRHYRRAASLVAATACIVCGCVALLTLHGDAVLENLFMLRHSTADMQGAWYILRAHVFAPNPRTPLLICALAGMVYLSRSATRHRTLQYYFCVAWLIALLQTVHIGSDTNVLLEPMIVTAIVAAVAISQVATMRPALLVALGALAVTCFLWPDAGLQKSREWFDQLRDDSKLARFAQGRNLLTDNPYVEAHSANPVLLDSYFNTLLERNGIWDSATFAKRVQRQEFDAILMTHQGRFPNMYRGVTMISFQVMRNMQGNYRPECEVKFVQGSSRTVVWLPAGKSVTPEMHEALRQAGCGPRTLLRPPA